MDKDIFSDGLEAIRRAIDSSEKCDIYIKPMLQSQQRWSDCPDLNYLNPLRQNLSIKGDSKQWQHADILKNI